METEFKITLTVPITGGRTQCNFSIGDGRGGLTTDQKALYLQMLNEAIGAIKREDRLARDIAQNGGLLVRA